jgi:hypothetical protein
LDVVLDIGFEGGVTTMATMATTMMLPTLTPSTMDDDGVVVPHSMIEWELPAHDKDISMTMTMSMSMSKTTR